ncbi:MAG: hypothetical protein HOV92_12475 [Streptomyces sp.]|nr:hypothetical protein [Streptomyces sp.]
MTLVQAPLLTDGAEHSAQTFRMMLRDMARGSEGVTEGNDLKVTALATPGTSVQVGDGSGVIKGRSSTWQGHYTAYNIGTEQVPIAATGASARTDLVVLRVMDPAYEGSLNPATDQICFFDVVSNVSSTAIAPPAGYTAIALARITVPASTSVITDSMITDLRSIANPRRQTSLLTQSPASISTGITGTAGTFSYFSTASGWSVLVPTWATLMKINLQVGQLRYDTNNFFGYLRATFGASLTMQQVALDDNQGTGVRRGTVVAGDTLTIPTAYQGTIQTLRVQAAGGASNGGGKVYVDGSTTLVAHIEFLEGLQ